MRVKTQFRKAGDLLQRHLIETRIKEAKPSIFSPRPFASIQYYNTRSLSFTTDQYPRYKRNPNFKELSTDDIDFFKSILSPSGILVDNGKNFDDLLPYNLDWMRKYRGKSRLVAKPKSTEEVAAILKYCNENRLAIVPQGGNTGLVGGGVPVFDEIILSTNNLNKIRSFDPLSGVLICDAGCILEVLDNYLAERGYMMPLDLGAKGSCHIGGNVATNAGGLRLLRYGSLHGSVLGLEVVLPDGTILHNLSSLRKDNTGYDLKQLFIGSEGTLGIITGAVNVAVFGLNSFQKVQDTFIKSKEYLTEILSAFEFWDSGALKLLKLHPRGRKFPIEGDHQFYVLVETHGSNKEHDDKKLEKFLEDMLGTQVIEDGVLAQDTTQIKDLWSFREGIPEACSKAGAVYKYDISIPVPVLYQMVQDVKSRLMEANVFGENKLVTNVIGYGHIGDGNLHLNITANSYDPKVTELIEPFVYEWTEKHKGSISAANHLGYSKSPQMINLMKTFKQSLDPLGIMNPYKFLPQ
ncbi:7708_t:CDS:10 [Ambispora gerdemannii]|uniref:D-2-hydroxyglutarate dehydrogenase, mitochondrial n=1 Tax=Ambispora gerdemannii TaxID=144530 RepID=A0A9N8UYT0_9GLOM|nr:7708_t:CDS:10 [Ambispora gerdemannii]